MSTQTTTATDTVSPSQRALGLVVTVAAVLFWGIVLLWAYTQTLARVQYGVVFLGGILTVYVLDQSRQAIQNDDYVDVAVLLASAVIMITASVYFALNFEDVYVRRQGWALDHEYLLAKLIVVSMLYLTWREFGNVFLGLVAGGILYAHFGYVVPGILGHGGISVNHMLQMLVTDLYGFFGQLTQLTAAWIAPFLLYAGLLFGYGAFQLILRLAIVSANYIESGVAQTAVLASAIIGSINGSYTANAGMTGSFTIPTMKDSGMSGRTAAGIEAVASTSGQVLPPVMGASAFVMASFLNTPYLDILIAGLIPAAILLVCIVVAVHYTAIADASDQSMEFSEFFEDELTTPEKVTEGIRFGVPFVVLIYLLGIRQWTVMSSALWTVVAMIVLGISVPVIRSIYDSSAVYDSWFVDRGDETRSAEPTSSSPESRSLDRLRLRIVRAYRAAVRFRPLGQFVTESRNTIHGFRRGAIILAPIAIILSAINGVVDLFTVTGVPNKIALMLISLSGGYLFVATLLAMGICIIMGVGMPTVAAYVIVSILVAPTLVQDFGVVELAAHYTVFYAAVLAGITPPVATAAVVTAGIAEADFWRVCGVAIKIAAPLFVLPIAFIYHPVLVSTTVGLPSIVAGALTLLGGITIIYGLNYPFELTPDKRMPLRIGLFALGAVVMVYPSALVQVIGAAAFAAVFVTEKVAVRGWSVPVLQGVGR